MTARPGAAGTAGDGFRIPLPRDGRDEVLTVCDDPAEPGHRITRKALELACSREAVPAR